MPTLLFLPVDEEEIMARIWTTRRVGFVMGMSLLWLPVANGQEIVDRREQARQWVLTSPQTIFAHYCAHCHGEDGKGGGRLWPSELSTKPANLTALDANEDYLIEAIREGSGVHGKSNLCPPWGRTISPTDIQRLSRYVLAIGSEAPANPDPPVLSQAIPTSEGVREPFPWLVCLFIAAEIGMLLAMIRKGKGGVSRVRQDPAVRG